MPQQRWLVLAYLLGLILGQAVVWAQAQPAPADEPLLQLARKFAATQPEHTNIQPFLPREGESARHSTSAPVPIVPPPVSTQDLLPLGPSSAGRAKNAAFPAAAAPRDANANWVMRTLLALVGVVGLILLLRSGYTKFSGRNQVTSINPVVEVLTRYALAPKSHVTLLRLGQRVLVVADSPNGLRLLANIKDPQEVAAILTTVAATKPSSVSTGFRKLLKHFSGEYHGRRTPGDEGDPGLDEAEYPVDHARDSVSGLVGRVRSAGRGEGQG